MCYCSPVTYAYNDMTKEEEGIVTKWTEHLKDQNIAYGWPENTIDVAMENPLLKLIIEEAQNEKFGVSTTTAKKGLDIGLSNAFHMTVSQKTNPATKDQEHATIRFKDHPDYHWYFNKDDTMENNLKYRYREAPKIQHKLAFIMTHVWEWTTDSPMFDKNAADRNRTAIFDQCQAKINEAKHRFKNIYTSAMYRDRGRTRSDRTPKSGRRDRSRSRNRERTRSNRNPRSGGRRDRSRSRDRERTHSKRNPRSGGRRDRSRSRDRGRSDRYSKSKHGRSGNRDLRNIEINEQMKLIPDSSSLRLFDEIEKAKMDQDFFFEEETQTDDLDKNNNLKA